VPAIYLIEREAIALRRQRWIHDERAGAVEDPVVKERWRSAHGSAGTAAAADEKTQQRLTHYAKPSPPPAAATTRLRKFGGWLKSFFIGDRTGHA
jgi:hypothetical protein